ncbi:MAG: glycosyltransferase, partial [Planctomycetota bacterium]
CIAWLFPSRFEGFGLPIVESLAARTPVIGTPTGAGTQFLTGPGSELVPIDDVVGMSDAMLRFAKMSECDWRTQSEAAWLKTRGWDWRAATAELESVLRETLNGKIANPSSRLAVASEV